jgi:hypothetical protein
LPNGTAVFLMTRNGSNKSMTLFSYIVKHDSGFPPNPFFGYCTLACCKPGIRRTAKEGDWIVGLTPKAQGNRIVYFMKVEEIMGFSEYWRDARFKEKKPKFRAGIERKTGDNIYKPRGDDKYQQLPSAHSRPRFGKREDRKKQETDLSGKRVLISEKAFAYFGSEAKELPSELKSLTVRRGYKCHFPPEVIEEFVHQFVRKWKLGKVYARPYRPPRSHEPAHGGTCS